MTEQDCQNLRSSNFHKTELEYFICRNYFKKAYYKSHNEDGYVFISKGEHCRRRRTDSVYAYCLSRMVWQENRGFDFYMYYLFVKRFTVITLDKNCNVINSK